ncbi:MAG: hypothetical protein HYX61_06555 [Gammaproteobacteria bacterium]|nr:hypothetical protein [Gammaproteobacteria bacterium]
MSKKGPHKSVLSKSKASSSVGVITFQNGLKQQSTTDFPKIAQDLIDAASTIAAIPNQTAHAAIFDKFSTYLSGQRFATHILEACSDILRTETTALKIKMALSKDDYDSKRLLTLSLEKRINAIYFLLECVIPKHEQMQELKLALLNLLWEDVVQIFENLNAIISLNLAPPGHNLSYIELANNSFTIFEKYSPFYTDILDNLINNKKTNLPLRTTSEMSRHVYQSYANFIIIEASTAFVRNILGETDAAMAALAQATQRLKVMRENLPKIIACAHLNKKSTEEAIERSLQKRISWLTDHFSQPPLMTNILLKSVLSTLDHSSNEFLSLLKMLHNSNDVASLLEDDLLVNEISAPIAELTKQIMTLTTAKLPISEGLNLETKMHFLNIWVNILQIERCNKSQAFTLLPMINKLLLAGRDFFLQDQRTILAKVIAEKFEEITKKSIQTRLQLSMPTKPELPLRLIKKQSLKQNKKQSLKQNMLQDRKEEQQPKQIAKLKKKKLQDAKPRKKKQQDAKPRKKKQQNAKQKKKQN